MEYRWHLVDAPAATTPTRQVFPTSGPGEFEASQDLAAGQIFYRWKITHTLVFVGADFDYFKAIDKDDRCGEVLIRYQTKCSGVWRTDWVGRFSTGGGRMNYSRCQFEARPETVDQYTCVLDALNKKVNALSIAPVSAFAAIAPSIEWGGAFAFALPSPCNRSWRVDLEGGDGDPINGWALAWQYVLPGFAGVVAIYWRERLTTFCVDGVPVPPPGGGWVLLENNCGTMGTATYVRPPTITYEQGDPQLGTCVDGVAIPPDTSCNWVQVMDCPPVGCAEPQAGPWFVCYAPVATEYTRARTLQAVTELALTATGCELSGVVSDFFDWDAPGDAVGYAPGINYVTGQPSQVDQLVILQNSDAIDPNASNPAVLGEVTLGQLLAFYLAAFRVYWDIENDFLRLESRKHWTFPVGLDLTTLSAPQVVVEPMETNSLNREIPQRERLRFPHAQGYDFAGADIIYSGPCVTEKASAAVKEYAAGPFTTDIGFIVADPAAISREGFTILATAFDGTDYSTIIDTGALSGNAVTNAPLSTANLQRDFWGWDRFLSTGNLNGGDVEFNAFLPTVKQPEIMVKCFCPLLRDFDPKKRVRTSLGQNHLQGSAAEVEKAVMDAHGHLHLFLRYAR